MPDSDKRLRDRYTYSEASRISGIDARAVKAWGHAGGGLRLTWHPIQPSGYPKVSFIGLGLLLIASEMKKTGSRINEIKSFFEEADRRLGIDWSACHETAAPGSLSSEDLKAMAENMADARSRVVAGYAEDGYVSCVRLPGYEIAEIMVDPSMNFGEPFFRRSGVPVEVALSRLRAGETLEDTSDDFNIPLDHLRDAGSRP